MSQTTQGRAPAQNTHPAQAPLGSRFWRLWSATGTSSLGDGLVLVAFPLLALTFTRSALLISGVAVAARLPALFFGIAAGALADRMDRRRLAVVVEWLRLGVLAAFGAALLGHAGGIALVYGTVFTLGCLEQLFVAATFALLPEIVDADALERANGHLSVADLTAEEVAGQGLGGALLALGRALPFLGDAVSFAASALLLRRALPERTGPVGGGRSTTLRADARDGLRWFLAHPVLPVTAALIGSFAFCQYVVVAVLVLYARHDLHLGPQSYGLLLAVAAIGNVVGALLSSRIVGRLGVMRAITAAGVTAAGAYLLLGAYRSVPAAGLAIGLECLAITVGNVASRSLRQRLIPGPMLGRVAMTFRTIIYAGMPLGAIVGGLLATVLSLRAAFVVAGIAQLVVIVALVPRIWGRAERPAIEL